MQHILLLLLAVVIVVGLACNTNKKASSTDNNEEPVPDPYLQTLHDIWVLETMDGKAVDRTQRRPQLELYPGEGRISGNGGCNQLFGQMEAVGWQITFRNVGTTKMFCRGLMETEGRFLELLGEVEEYQIKNLKLILLKDDKPQLILQKVD